MTSNLLPHDARPIGVFDSGVGGLSVLNVLIKNFPSENFVYLGDTARLPYGSKSPATIQKYVIQNINYLVKHQNIKAIVVACNSASTVLPTALTDLNFKYDIPILGVIGPGAKSAYKSTKNKKIGLWATRATVKQGSYEKALKDLDPAVKVFQVPCPLLVPLVEEGLWDHPITEATIDLYLSNLKNTHIDTLILGCTHYPFIRKKIEDQILKQNLNIQIVDSAEAVSADLRLAFEQKILTKNNSETNIKLLLTDEASHFMDLVLKTFPDWKNIKFQLIDLQQIV